MKRMVFMFTLLLFIFSACQQSKSNTNYYLLLMGESESWKLTNYEIMLTKDKFQLGNGKLMMKDIDEYETDFFSFSTYIVKNGVEDRVHGGSVSGPANLKEQLTGTIKGEGGQSPELNDIQDIYMEIEWRDKEKGEDVSERINLYDQNVEQESFLRDEID